MLFLTVRFSLVGLDGFAPNLPPPPPSLLKMADQIEKAFQKQDGVFAGKKRIAGKGGNKDKLRFFKNVGLGFKTPTEAKEVRNTRESES